MRVLSRALPKLDHGLFKLLVSALKCDTAGKLLLTLVEQSAIGHEGVLRLVELVLSFVVIRKDAEVGLAFRLRGNILFGDLWPQRHCLRRRHEAALLLADFVAKIRLEVAHRVQFLRDHLPEVSVDCRQVVVAALFREASS